MYDLYALLHKLAPKNDLMTLIYWIVGCIVATITAALLVPSLVLWCIGLSGVGLGTILINSTDGSIKRLFEGRN